ncbi:fumarate reductase subunit C [Motilimonas cestriensis]|uniref:Fumarate reductase subunit C n=1 Tax=Motilimonas cestriensis TaxID=2742685 RepID=A0ABS8W806_9GAMM|nr:fumarate reductase subunit C [Motilimonas cestriensis]MCE2595134.1 fumarate reductase subunit C [Motilimonas cestriensis]
MNNPASKRKPYQRELPVDWWLKHAFYTKYMIREGTSIAITIYSCILAWGLLRLSQGPEAWQGWLDALQHPIAILFHIIALGLALYHTVTWFDLAPKAADIWLKGKKLDDKFIVIGHYAGFVLASLAALIIITL